MRSGDPFETKALDELRSKQRRLLRMVPDWLFEIYAPSEKIVGSSVSAPLEEELRSEADAAWEKLDVDFTKRMKEARCTEILADFLSQQDKSGVQIGSAGRTFPSNIFERRVAELRAQSTRAAIHDEPERDLAVPLARYVRLLIWADDLASDGYRDPRLAEDRER